MTPHVSGTTLSAQAASAHLGFVAIQKYSHVVIECFFQVFKHCRCLHLDIIFYKPHYGNHVDRSFVESLMLNATTIFGCRLYGFGVAAEL